MSFLNSYSTSTNYEVGSEFATAPVRYDPQDLEDEGYPISAQFFDAPLDKFGRPIRAINTIRFDYLYGGAKIETLFDPYAPYDDGRRCVFPRHPTKVQGDGTALSLIKRGAAQEYLDRIGANDPYKSSVNYQVAMSMQDSLVNVVGGVAIGFGAKMLRPGMQYVKGAILSEETMLRMEMNDIFRAGLNADLRLLNGGEASALSVPARDARFINGGTIAPAAEIGANSAGQLIATNPATDLRYT